MGAPRRSTVTARREDTLLQSTATTAPRIHHPRGKHFLSRQGLSVYRRDRTAHTGRYHRRGALSLAAPQAGGFVNSLPNAALASWSRDASVRKTHSAATLPLCSSIAA